MIPFSDNLSREELSEYSYLTLNLKLVVYEHMGHMSHVEKPEESARDASAFIRALA